MYFNILFIKALLDMNRYRKHTIEGEAWGWMEVVQKARRMLKNGVFVSLLVYRELWRWMRCLATWAHGWVKSPRVGVTGNY